MEPINYQIIVNELSIKNNDLASGTFAVAPTFQRTTWKIDEEHAATRLVVELKNTKENPFPIDIIADMTAIFETVNIPEGQTETFLRINGVQMMLPYIRAMVTNLTTAAMAPPVLLPMLDASTLFPD